MGAPAAELPGRALLLEGARASEDRPGSIGDDADQELDLVIVEGDQAVVVAHGQIALGRRSDLYIVDAEFGLKRSRDEIRRYLDVGFLGDNRADTVVASARTMATGNFPLFLPLAQTKNPTTSLLGSRSYDRPESLMYFSSAAASLSGWSRRPTPASSRTRPASRKRPARDETRRPYARLPGHKAIPTGTPKRSIGATVQGRGRESLKPAWRIQPARVRPRTRRQSRPPRAAASVPRSRGRWPTAPCPAARPAIRPALRLRGGVRKREG